MTFHYRLCEDTGYGSGVRHAAVAHLLEVMVDPVVRSVDSAPVEEEEITPDMAAQLDRARASIDRGEGISHEEILREFGLTPRS